MPPPDVARVLEQLHARLGDWCVHWGLSILARQLTVEIDGDLGPDLGRCDLRTHRVILHGVLLQPANEALLFETLCHEAAHAVAFHRYGTGIASHGPEWRDYMEQAGFSPRERIPRSEIVW